MRFLTRDVQARCAAFDVDPGIIDGIDGPKTRSAVNRLLEIRGGSKIEDLFHPSGLHRINWHWTAGAYGDIAMERRAYNGLVLEDGTRVAGDFAPEAQATYSVGRAASHTRNCNTGVIGLSVDAMAGAVEVPFSRGSAPLTWEQINALCAWTAELCVTYDIPVSRFSTMSHSEVQPTLGIRQRFKWDINWLPDMDRPGDPIEVGDRLRDMVEDAIDALSMPAVPPAVEPSTCETCGRQIYAA